MSGFVLFLDQWNCFLGDLVVRCGTLTCTGILSVLEPGALVCELYHLIFDAIFLFIPQFYIMMKNFLCCKTRTCFTGSRDRRCVWVNFGLMLSWWVFVCVTYLWSGCILCFRNITAFLSTMKVRRLKLKSTSYLCPLWSVGFRQLPSAFRIVLVSIPSIYS